MLQLNGESKLCDVWIVVTDPSPIAKSTIRT